MTASSHPHYVPPKSRQGGLGVWYRAAIVVVAIVLAGLPWCRSDRSGYIAHGDAVITSDSAEPEAHAHLQSLSEEILKATTGDADFANFLAQRPELQKELGAKDEQSAIEMFRRRLEVTPNRVGGQVTLHLTFYASNRQLCEDVLSRYLHDFHDEFQHWKKEKTSTIQTSYSQQVDTVQSELTRITNELARLQPVPQEEPRRLPATPPPPQVNKQWTVVSVELNEAQQQLRSLKVSRTDRHPLVVDQQEKVDKLTELLASTPKYPAVESHTSEPKQEDKGAITTERNLRITDLQRQRRDAESRLTALGQVKQHADKALGFVDGIRMDIPGDHAKVATVGGAWKISGLLVLTGWTIFAAVVAFMLASAAARPELIRSPSKLASVTSVPVTATMTLPGSSDFGSGPSFSLAGPASFLLTRTAELTVIGVLGLVVLAMQTQPGASALLTDDPLALLRESMRVVWPSTN
ncbi:hypothetical protein [Blastopirellula marina]|uniref:hypothetical protein n=1 Tax=Blastopirellula marina TaxID=124 RepID=UPI0011B0003C|nr:hypothetical protein [Blastopirellula marina]